MEETRKNTAAGRPLSGWEKLYETDPEWAEIVENFSNRQVPEKSRLTERERMLCVLSALLGCQGTGEFQDKLHCALRAGIDPAAVKEVIYQATAYLGTGRIRDFLELAGQIMKQHGVRQPLARQGTAEKENRFEKGLEKQVALFGEGMAKRQTEGPVLRRNINRWLAENCFGGYYTRNGLSDGEREMATFCFLLAQGGCENQLRGHVKGNLKAGNGKEKLYSVVEQCLPYIGYPRSLNAMNVIDEAVGNGEE